MIKFVGEFRAKVDDKGRLVFPSAFKAVMGDAPLHFIVKKDTFDPCLSIYTADEWEKMSEDVKSRLNFFNREHNNLWRILMSNRAAVEPDPKLGRIAIPKYLLDQIQVKKEVVFKGLDHKIELWAAELSDSLVSGTEDEATLAERILGNN